MAGGGTSGRELAWFNTAQGEPAPSLIVVLDAPRRGQKGMGKAKRFWPAALHECAISLSVEAGEVRERVQLNVYISRASDGYFLLKTIERPELAVRASTMEEIADAVRAAAAAETGLAPNNFEIIMDL